MLMNYGISHPAGSIFSSFEPACDAPSTLYGRNPGIPTRYPPPGALLSNPCCRKDVLCACARYRQFSIPGACERAPRGIITLHAIMPRLMLGLTPAELLARAVVLIIAFTVHEFSHAFVADYFGDDTPRSQGRLTLNPLVHLDPIGSLLLLVAGFGWAKPVQINPYALQRRSPAAPMLVALAGPTSNLLMAALAAIPLRLQLVNATLFVQQSQLLPTFDYLITIFVVFNLILMLFNLLPIFPLDGEKVLDYFLPPSAQAFMDSLRPYGMIILIVVVFVLPNFLQAVVFEPALKIFTFLTG